MQTQTWKLSSCRCLQSTGRGACQLAGASEVDLQGDLKALDLASDEEERIEPKVSSLSYHIGKHVLICDATDRLGAIYALPHVKPSVKTVSKKVDKLGAGASFQQLRAGASSQQVSTLPPLPPPLSASHCLPSSLPPLPLIPPYLPPPPPPSYVSQSACEWLGVGKNVNVCGKNVYLLWQKFDSVHQTGRPRCGQNGKAG
jgi:hypothetical protein